MSVVVVWRLRVDVREATSFFFIFFNCHYVTLKITRLLLNVCWYVLTVLPPWPCCGKVPESECWAIFVLWWFFILCHGNHSYSRLQPDRFWSGVWKRKLDKLEILNRRLPLIGPDGWVGRQSVESLTQVILKIIILTITRNERSLTDS